MSAPHYGPEQPVCSPVSCSVHTDSASCTPLPQPQPQPCPVPGNLQPTQRGCLQAGSGLSLKKQVGHANQQTGFSDSTSLCPVHPQAQHMASGLLAAPLPGPRAGATSRKPGFMAPGQPGPQPPLQSAQLDPEIPPQMSIRLYLQSHPISCHGGRSLVCPRPVIATATRGDQASPPVKGTLALCPRKPFMSHLAPGGARLPHGTASPHHQGLVHFPTPCCVP